MAQQLKKSIYGQGPTLVLLHGWGLNSGVWQPIIEKLSNNYKVITVDLPGFGENVECLPTIYSLATISEIVVACVGEEAIYLGWSLGGLVASNIALLYPKQCKALVTVASTPCFMEKGDWPGMKANILSAFYQQLSKDIGKTLNNFLKIQAMGSPNLRHELKLIQKLVMEYPLPSELALRAGLDLLAQSDLRNEVANICQPTLRVYGKLDSLVPQKVQPLVELMQPSSQSYLLAKASHAPFISHQSDFVEVLDNWLEKLPVRHLN